jgi:hypothetical protein
MNGDRHTSLLVQSYEEPDRVAMGLPQQFVDRLSVDPRQYVGDRVNTSPQGSGY